MKKCVLLRWIGLNTIIVSSDVFHYIPQSLKTDENPAPHIRLHLQAGDSVTRKTLQGYLEVVFCCQKRAMCSWRSIDRPSLLKNNSEGK